MPAATRQNLNLISAAHGHEGTWVAGKASWDQKEGKPDHLSQSSSTLSTHVSTPAWPSKSILLVAPLVTMHIYALLCVCHTLGFHDRILQTSLLVSCSAALDKNSLKLTKCISRAFGAIAPSSGLAPNPPFRERKSSPHFFFGKCPNQILRLVPCKNLVMFSFTMN